MDGANEHPAEAPVVVKKKPGRPKKENAVVAVEVHGIVEQPASPGAMLELIYRKPELFKKIIHLFKQFSVSEVELIFDGTGLRIACQDHLRKSDIQVTIDGACMNWYYCRNPPIRLCISRKDLSDVLSVIDKTFTDITIMLKENYRSTMYLILCSTEYKRTLQYEIGVGYRQEDGPGIAGHHDDGEYPLKFKMDTKSFKSLLSHTKKFDNHIKVQKCGEHPLQFGHNKAQNVNCTGIWDDAARMDIKSAIAANDIFSAAICIDYIQPFATCALSDDVYIAADKEKKMSFTAHLNQYGPRWAAVVKIYTEIMTVAPPPEIN